MASIWREKDKKNKKNSINSPLWRIFGEIIQSFDIKLVGYIKTPPLKNKIKQISGYNNTKNNNTKKYPY